MKPSKTELKRNITQAMIREHGEGLIRFFGLDPNLVDPINLCKKLRRLENKAHEITTQLCNGLKNYLKLSGTIITNQTKDTPQKSKFGQMKRVKKKFV
jgi:hypothetical protein